MMTDIKLPAAIVQLNKWKASLHYSQFCPILEKKPTTFAESPKADA